MASERQIAANRRNAKQSTGPRTAEGKLQSRRNAFRHGLTAETVITSIENAHDYRKFEKAIIAEFEPATATEHELTVRLASLFWRLRRSTAIESGLFDIQKQSTRKRHTDGKTGKDPLRVFRNLLSQPGTPDANYPTTANAHMSRAGDISSQLAQCFLPVAMTGMLDRFGRYEKSLWRQAAQIMMMLNLQQKLLIKGRWKTKRF